jgi:hypothetical protein
MRLQAATSVAAAGLVLFGGGIAAAVGGHSPAGNGARPAGNGARAAYGRVAGKFEREGGPMGPGGEQPPVVPLSGRIVFSRHGHRAIRVRAGNSGRFSVRLTPGDYTVWGRAEGLPVCRLPGGLRARAGRTRHIVVACIVP